MLFSSLGFLGIFLPLVVAGAVLLGRWSSTRAVLLFLTAASLVFYGWAYPPYLFLLSISIAANFLIGVWVDRRRSKTILWIGVALNLGLLGWFKYAGFLSTTLSWASGAHIDVGTIILPLAISFFTFQQIGYLVDIYRGTIRAGEWLHYIFFVSFFPQLIAGPIIHYRELQPQILKPAFARFLSRDLIAGALLFGLGLAKKVLLADQFRFGADRIFDAAALGLTPSFIEAWIGMFCYGFQIYFDFSGYSDMALGLGRLFGVKFPVNFRSPYKTTSIIDFWRRWNITLSFFLRDYLYIPLGGNRRGWLPRYINLFIVMLLGGLWHGANWTFVVWGGLHGVFLSVNHAWRYFVGKQLPSIVSLALTFAAVTLAWVFFRAGNFTEAATITGAMLGTGPNGATASLFPDLPFLAPQLAAGAAIVWLMPNVPEITERFENGNFRLLRRRGLLAGASFVAALSIFFVYSAGTYEFLYFQF